MLIYKGGTEKSIDEKFGHKYNAYAQLSVKQYIARNGSGHLGIRF